MRAFLHVVSFALAAALSIRSELPAQFGFRAGDLFLYTPSTVTNGYMLLRIDPLSPTPTPLIHFDTTWIAQARDGACYDPARDRILVSAGLTSSTPELWAVDFLGNATSLGHSGYWLNQMTARGDGIVYCTQVPGTLTEILVLDSIGGLQPLMDSAGAAPFVAPIFDRMIYHPGENALYLAENAWFTGACSPGTWTGDMINLHRVPLTANGMRVAGPVTCASLDISTSAQAATGWSLLPGGDLLLVVDTNSNSLEPRMQRIDPTTLAASTFASNGPYIGAASKPAGIWSNTLGRAVLVDTYSHVLRAFGPGEAGAGTVLPPVGVTFPAFNHSVLRLFEIGPVATTASLTGSPRDVSLATGGLHTLEFDSGTQGGAMYWILGSISGWNPGLDVLGTTVWVRPDFYTNYTISSPNAGILSGTLGGVTAGVPSIATVSVPPALPPALAGIVVHHCAAVFDTGLNPLYATNPVSLRLVP